MKKETFVEVIEAIKKQCEHDEIMADKLSEVYKDSRKEDLYYYNAYIMNALIGLLQEGMDDMELCQFGQSWIEYFMFELDFGAKNDTMKVYQSGKEIKMSTSGELYDYLKDRQKWKKLNS